MFKRLKSAIGILAVLTCLNSFSAQLPYGQNIAEQKNTVQNGDWAPVIQKALKNASEGQIIFFPKGEYKTKSPLIIEKSVTLLFERGARLRGEGEDVIRIEAGGKIIIEGLGGQGELINEYQKVPGYKQNGGINGRSPSVINVDFVRKDASPSLLVKNMYIKGFAGIQGYEEKDKGKLGDVEIIDCRFECTEKDMAHKHSEVRSLRIEGCLLTGTARYGIYFTSPMPEGAVVKNNTIKNIGVTAIQLSGGKASQIDDGCVEYLSSAIVHDNRILGGGHRAKFTTAYIHGILVYGHNVSIQGNIVRDFNRGEPVPGAPCGQYLKLEDGTYFRGAWRQDGDKKVRVAGSAIYAKARQGIIANNICSNSGWRSVIEVKTGGREPYVMVCNNVVDGRSLSIEGSFGFECNSGKSVWSGNLVYDMPAEAFVVRGQDRYNTFTNNVIFNAKIGFALPYTADRAENELIMNNRFVNVAQPVALEDGKIQKSSSVHALPPLIVTDINLLPPPSENLRGQLAVILSPDGDTVLICSKHEKGYCWKELSGNSSKNSMILRKEYLETGKNLNINPDQSSDKVSEEEAKMLCNPQKEAQKYSVFPCGWLVTITDTARTTTPSANVNVKDFLKYDEKLYKTGKRSLRIGEGDSQVNCQLLQRIKLPPGKTYRAKATMRATIPDKISMYIKYNDEILTARNKKRNSWEDLSVDFSLPENSNGEVTIIIHGSKFGADRLAWIDNVSVHELKEKN
ncbi:MAG: hypothetical protein A2017_05825 [Lentisphaerae bacterium GWF2_44_16]|nr:MAG: hypothetical protein A2017_05825 [Lentisphaerae bacterium GWF2_44_16]